MNEKNQILQVKPERLYQNAVKYMKQLCGNIDCECEEIRSFLQNKVFPQMLYSIYEKECVSEKGIKLEEEQILIDWNEYTEETIKLEKIEKVVVYFLTIGECKTEETENMLEKFYIDGWKNAYLEAMRAYSKEYIRKITKCAQICDTFAPGIAGISIAQIEQFFAVLSGERIGVSYWKNSMLMPEKTVAGVYLLMKDTDVKYEKNCKNCIGKITGCRYCAKGYMHFDIQSLSKTKGNDKNWNDRRMKK